MLLRPAAAASIACLLASAVEALPQSEAGAKVKVFLMMGQSNMLGEGKIGGPDPESDHNGTLYYAVTEEGKYPYLWDSAAKNVRAFFSASAFLPTPSVCRAPPALAAVLIHLLLQWSVSKTVRNVFVMGSGGPTSPVTVQTNDFMTGGQGHRGSIGPELGIGFALEDHYSADPVMALKSCIGNRALGWDLLPPTQKSFDWTDPKNSSEVWTYAGYHQSPNRWLKGTTPVPITWTAGCQYDGDLKRADDVLADLKTYYPGQTEAEVAGFFWWQGDRDSRDPALSERYEQNLVALIKALRLRYKVPNAPFVTASLGQSTLPASACTGNCGGEILQAMLNVADATKYPEFKASRTPFHRFSFSLG